jgi:membrane protein implicated in regulation of membrane protease activity
MAIATGFALFWGISMLIAFLHDPSNEIAGLPAFIATIALIASVVLSVITVLLGSLAVRFSKRWREL